MTAIELSGKPLANAIEVDLRQRVEKLRNRRNGRAPILATILVGSDPSSATYVRMKQTACNRVGMASFKVELPEETTTPALLEEIHRLNVNPDVHGILLQHPCPPQIDERRCFDAIDVRKDVDGVTSHGFGRMAMGEIAYGSATPLGIMKLLEYYRIPLAGKHAVVVGRSPILGKPVAAMLLNANATVTICHSRTMDLPKLVAQADIVVGAVGKPQLIRSAWIKNGAVVVDAGYVDGIGDIESKSLGEKAFAYTPVPGGVGPMTIATLMLQTVDAAESSPCQ